MSAEDQLVYLEKSAKMLDESQYVTDCSNHSLCNYSNYNNDSALYQDFDGWGIDSVVRIVVPILFGLIVVVGLVGNALVVVVVSFNKQMRNTTNFLIINLALADLLFIVFCVPFTATDYALTVWPFGDTWCKIVQYLVIVCAYASVYTLVLMSLDRFLAVVHPITSMSIRTERNTLLAIFILWVIIVVSCVPALFTHGTMGDEEHFGCLFLMDEYNYAVFEVIFFLSSYVIPLAVTCVLYLFMLKRLWTGSAPGGRVSAESLRGKKRVTRLVIVVVAVFAISWCPIQVVLLLKSLDYYEMTPGTVVFQITAHILGYMNSCVNPILYAFLSENFRKAFRKVITCVPKRSSAGDVSCPKHLRTGSCEKTIETKNISVTVKTYPANINENHAL